jgi:hypothetical protein
MDTEGQGQGQGQGQGGSSAMKAWLRNKFNAAMNARSSARVARAKAARDQRSKSRESLPRFLLSLLLILRECAKSQKTQVPPEISISRSTLFLWFIYTLCSTFLHHVLSPTYHCSLRCYYARGTCGAATTRTWRGPRGGSVAGRAPTTNGAAGAFTYIAGIARCLAQSRRTH